MGLALGALALAAGGAAYAAHESSQARQQAAQSQRAMVPEISTVAQQAPRLLNLGYKYDYLNGQQQMGMMDQYMSKVLEGYPDLAYAERQQTALQRQADSRDLRTTGAQMQRTLEGLAPELKESGNALLEMLRGVGDQSPLLGSLNQDALHDGMSPINQRLQDYAMQQMDLGGNLSDDERRRVVQDARAGYSARGMLGSDASTIEEVLNLDSARRAREMERIGLAGNINQQLLGEQLQDRNFGLGVENLNQNRLQSARAFIPAAINAGNARLAPMLSLFNQRSAVQPGSVANIYATTPNLIGSSSHMISDVLNYGRDVNDSNFNAEQAQAIARGNNAAAIGGAAMSMAGTMGGQAIQARARNNQYYGV